MSRVPTICDGMGLVSRHPRFPADLVETILRQNFRDVRATAVVLDATVQASGKKATEEETVQAVFRVMTFMVQEEMVLLYRMLDVEGAEERARILWVSRNENQEGISLYLWPGRGVSPTLGTVPENLLELVRAAMPESFRERSFPFIRGIRVVTPEELLKTTPVDPGDLIQDVYQEQWFEYEREYDPDIRCLYEFRPYVDNRGGCGESPVTMDAACEAGLSGIINLVRSVDRFPRTGYSLEECWVRWVHSAMRSIPRAVSGKPRRRTYQWDVFVRDMALRGILIGGTQLIDATAKMEVKREPCQRGHVYANHRFVSMIPRGNNRELIVIANR